LVLGGAPAVKSRHFAENALRLDLADVLQACRSLTPAAKARWPASPGATVLAAVPVPVTRRGLPVGRVLLDVLRLGRHGQARVIDGPGIGTVMELKAEAARLIGFRWGLSCPLTGERCRVLYLPPGAAVFGSRQGHGLAYRSLYEPPLVRRYRHARRLRRCLGEVLPEVTGPLPVRPATMRGGTYLRRCMELAAVEAVLEDA
jgi:hypothetical protein